MAEVEPAWAAANAACKALGSANPALRAEAAVVLLATIIKELGDATLRPDDLADVLPIGEALMTYVMGRVAVIVTSSGDA